MVDDLFVFGRISGNSGNMLCVVIKFLWGGSDVVGLRAMSAGS